MERRRAVAIAAAVATTTVGAIAAITANFGLLESRAPGSSPAGQLDAGRVAEVVTPVTATAPSPGGVPNEPHEARQASRDGDREDERRSNEEHEDDD